MYKLLFALAIALCLALPKLHAANGDTTHIITHNQQLVVTDPNLGSNEYKAWGVFPSTATHYRKALVYMSYRCPTNQNCGEWDYIDQIWLRRKGGVDSIPLNLEMVRFITPYGNSFNGSWNFMWHADISDFAYLLHDSIEIGYVHTGYETNIGRGWVLTLDFALVEGPEPMPPLGYSTLWNGNWIIGDANNPIENYLPADTLSFDANAALGRIRINHTGHGADNANGCSEFCDLYRDLVIDGNQVDRFHRWRKCGANPLYPQGGTWVYDRGNWCPGAVVYPYIYDMAVQPSSTHSIDLNMQPYTTSAPAGNEYIVGYLFQYGAPVNANDVSVDEILRPNKLNEYARFNPICSNPQILVTNNGSASLTSAVINYGYIGQPVQTYNWSGSIASLKTDTITLPGIVVPAAATDIFKVYFTSINGGADAYVMDDTAYSKVTVPTAFPDTAFFLELRSNNEGVETSYQLTDELGTVLYSRGIGVGLPNNTTFRDTFHLAPGCYSFTLFDDDLYGGDGLSFWANPSGGTGYARFKRIGGPIIKNFGADFGAVIWFNFTILNTVGINDQPVGEQQILVYPNPSEGLFTLDLSMPEAQDVMLEVYDVNGKKIREEKISQALSTNYALDLSNEPKGMYFIKLYNERFTTTQRVVTQ